MTDPTDTPLPELRAQLDAVDHEVLELLARRQRIVADVARYKQAEKVQIRDATREAQLLDSRRKLAAGLGLDPDLIESIYRQILDGSRDYQAAMNLAAAPAEGSKTVLLVGGAGAMGRVLQGLFASLNHRVLVSDVGTSPALETLVPQADVVVITVPIAVTEQVIRQVGPLLRPDALLLDVTSIKAAPLAAMLESTPASVVGTHPLFGPGSTSLMGQRVVLCRGRGDAWYSWLSATFRARGLIITEAAADEHDRAMGLVQVLTHFQTQVFGLTLSRMGIPLASSRKFTSPAYLLELYVAARHFAQSAELYGPIEMRNPATAAITEQFQQAAHEIAGMLTSGDQARFAELFREVRAFFGEFAQEATEQSRFLIDRLVERTLT